MNTRQLFAATAALALGAAQAQADIGARVDAARRSGSSQWLTWQVPAIDDGGGCCWSSGSRRGACSLSSDNYSIGRSDDRPTSLDERLDVYVHVTSEGVDKVRTFSNSCSVDHAGERVESVSGVPANESISYLATLVTGADDRSTKRRSDGALTAIAQHEDASATAVLERFAREGATKSMRHNAAFWLGNTREQAGYDALVRLRASDDERFREHLTFCFSQSGASAAQGTLIDMAKNDPASRVRGQALFWLAQKAQKRADADVIRQAVESDPDTEIKKKAVFALSQIPRGEGVPDLIRVARENSNREVRKQAMFWLGQSKDKRALEFFESVLAK
jgi:hypothetical protein